MLLATLVAVLAVLVAVLVTAEVRTTGTTRGDTATALPPAPRLPAPAPTTPGTPTSLPVAPLGPDARARCPVQSVACVDLVAHEAWLQHDGAVVLGPVPILPGAQTGLLPPGPASSATPVGTFRVLRKDAHDFSSEFHEPMPNAVYFAPHGIAFHQGSLTTSSNGCVHLDPAASQAFYRDLRVGDGVTVF